MFISTFRLLELDFIHLCLRGMPVSEAVRARKRPNEGNLSPQLSGDCLLTCFIRRQHLSYALGTGSPEILTSPRQSGLQNVLAHPYYRPEETEREKARWKNSLVASIQGACIPANPQALIGLQHWWGQADFMSLPLARRHLSHPSHVSQHFFQQ